MEEHAYEGQVAMQLESADLTVAPGSSVNVPVTLHNLGTTDGFFEISVRGIAGTWVSVPVPVIRLAAGEQRQVLLTIQPPLPPQGRAGRYHVVVRVASQAAPQVAAEATCTLTVAALVVPGRIGMLLAAAEFSVIPGGSTTLPLVLLNRGLDADTFALSVEGIPLAWVYAPAATVTLAPGQQQEVTLTVQPPPSGQAPAGRLPFRIQVSSRAAPGQVAGADCILSIAPLTRFGAELRPERIEAGQPARVVVENQGNVQQAFTVGWQSAGGEVIFEPAEAQQIRVPPGEVGMVEFVVRPRSRPFLGREESRPFTARVEAPNREARNLTGEVMTRAWLPAWVLPAIGIAFLALIAAVVLIAVLGGGDSGAAPTQLPVTESPPAVETDVVPTEPPPTEEATVAPTDEPVPTEEATAAPTDEPAPTDEAPDGGEGEGPSLPCLPAALGLVVIPLLVTSKRRA